MFMKLNLLCHDNRVVKKKNEDILWKHNIDWKMANWNKTILDTKV